MKQLIFNIIALIAGFFVLLLSGAFVIVVSLVVLVLSPILKKKGINLDAKAKARWQQDFDKFRQNQHGKGPQKTGNVIEGDYKEIK